MWLVKGVFAEREDNERMSTSGISVRMVAKKSPMRGWLAGASCGGRAWLWEPDGWVRRGELLFLLFADVGENSSSSEGSSSLTYSIRLPT